MAIFETESRNLLTDYLEIFRGNLDTKINLPTSLDRSTHVGIRQQARITVLAEQSKVPNRREGIDYNKGSFRGYSYG